MTEIMLKVLMSSVMSIKWIQIWKNIIFLMKNRKALKMLKHKIIKIMSLTLDLLNLKSLKIIMMTTMLEIISQQCLFMVLINHGLKPNRPIVQRKNQAALTFKSVH